MPRAIDRLTYTVPEQLCAIITVGQLVTIPFRSSDIFGLVYALTDETPVTKSPLKPLSTIAIETPLCTKNDLDRMVWLADYHHIGLGIIANLMMPPLQKRKLAKQTLTPLLPVPLQSPALATIVDVYAEETTHGELLRQYIQGTTLILVPEQNTITDILQHLPPELQSTTVCWDSTLTQKEQFERWFRVRNAETNIVIGTRSSMFLPWQTLHTIIIDYEADENHKHFDQFPRYDVRDLALRYQRDYGANIVRLSAAPSTESYYRVHTGEWRFGNGESQKTDTIPTPIAENIRHITTRPGIEIVDMRDERRAKNFELFADRSSTAMIHTTDDVFIFTPRRGYASSVGCHDCGLVFECPTCKRPLIYHESTRTLRCHYCKHSQPMALTCPACQSVAVQLNGIGTELVEKTVRALLPPTRHHDIIRIDGDKDETGPKHSGTKKIIIGTQKAIPAVNWDRTGLIIVLGLDSILGLPELLATEQVWYRLLQFAYRRRETSQLLVQTYHKEQLVFRSLLEPDRFYRTELGNRKQFQYPPYSGLIRYIVSGLSEQECNQTAAKLRVELQQKLTVGGLSATMDGPFTMNPPIYRGRYSTVIIVKYHGAKWQESARTIHAALVTPCVIDPCPLSLLSP